jgi:hypothetical protein
MALPPAKRRRLLQHGSPSQEKARMKHLRSSSPPPLPHRVEALDDARQPQHGDVNPQVLVQRQVAEVSQILDAVSSVAGEVLPISVSASIALDEPSNSAITSIINGVTSILDPSNSVPTATDGSNNELSSVEVPSTAAATPASSAAPETPAVSDTPTTGDVPAGSTSTDVLPTTNTTVPPVSTSSLPVLTSSTSSLSLNSTSSSQ